MMQSYRNLQVWQKSMELVDLIYLASKNFPKEEMFGLSSQLRRSSVSIASNIAEGSQRGKREFIHFVMIAYSSLAELETQVEIAFRQEYLSDEQRRNIFNLTAEIGRMLNGLSKGLESSTANRKLQTGN